MTSKIVFVLSHALYLRNFQSVIVELAKRGHVIELSLMTSRDGEAEYLDQLRQRVPQLRVVDPPARDGWWWAAADPLRALADFVHYQQPAYATATTARNRVAKRVPRLVRVMATWGLRNTWLRQWVQRILRRIDDAMPANAALSAWLDRAPAPDILAISPLIDLDYAQFDLLKAAKAKGIATIHLVASWDNLTNKGGVQIAADRIALWNDAQRREAVQLHQLPADRIVTTGAQLYDRWFTMTPTRDREAFCDSVGLAPNAPIILYVGSSQFICPDEVAFFKRWLGGLRASSDPVLVQANVLVRPHPLHVEQWRDLDLAHYPNVAIWPLDARMPIGDRREGDYFDTLFHSAVVVGINTSVFLESAIVGRPVLTVGDASFKRTQEGMLHFGHVKAGNLVVNAVDMDEHIADLSDHLKLEPSSKPDMTPFIESFLRPHGLHRQAAPILAAAIETTVSQKDAQHSNSLLSRLIRACLWPIAALYLRPGYHAALQQRDIADGIDR